MSHYELEFACLIPRSKSEELLTEPYVSYKGTDYKKTVRLRVPWQPIKSIKRFWHWICFVWSHSRSRKCRRICYLLLLTIFLTFFLITCVILPLVFKHSREYCKYVVFNPTITTHELFDKPIKMEISYDVTKYYKPSNTYVTVNETENIKLGVWSLNPLSVKSPYLIYFHGHSGDRRSYIVDYSKLASFFHIITFDYRGYGDSTLTELNEEGLVNDSKQFVKWVISQTNVSVFIWGDTLGASIAARTVAELHKENIFPCGLMMENSFKTMEDQLSHSWLIAKITSYLPWYKTTIIDPLEENDLSFNITKYISEIDSPINFWEWNSDTARGKDNNFNLINQESQTFVAVYYYSKRDGVLSSRGEDFIRSFIGIGTDYCKTKKVKH